MRTNAVPIRRRIFDILFRWLPMILWMAWIFWLSAQPNLPHPARRIGLSDHLFDYAAHAFTFGVLAALIWRVLAPRRGWVLPASIFSPPLLSALFSTLYAISDEVHQAFVPGRWAKVSDWLADMVGILVVVGLIAWVDRHQVRDRIYRLIGRAQGKT